MKETVSSERQTVVVFFFVHLLGLALLVPIIPFQIVAPLLGLSLWFFAVVVAVDTESAAARMSPAVEREGVVSHFFFSSLYRLRRAGQMVFDGRFTIFSLGAGVLLYFGCRAISATLYRHGLLQEPEFNLTFLVAFSFLSAFAARFLSFYSNLQSGAQRASSWDSLLDALILRFFCGFYVLYGCGLLLELYSGWPLHVYLSGLAILVTAFLLGEGLLRSFVRLYQPERIWREGPPIGFSLLFRVIGGSEYLQLSRRADFSERSDVNLSEMWLLPTLRRSLLPLTLSAGFVLWIASAVHVVPAGSEGLHLQFGRLSGAVKQPGLHFTLPAPLGKVEIIDVKKLRSVYLGMDDDPGQPILWDKQHYLGEKRQLVGEGNDFLTISVPIFYSVKDSANYFRHVRDAKALVRLIAYRNLFHLTLDETAFAIMTEKRDSLQSSLKTVIQADLDSISSGISIDLVSLRDIHPPVEVASAFQEVISAEEDRETWIHNAEAYRAENIPRARSDNQRITRQSDAQYAVRSHQASGEAQAFGAILASYQLAPELFRHRSFYGAIDQNLKGAKKLIVDEQYAGNLPAYVDLRRVLNPSLAKPAAAAVQSLVPSVRGRASEFDRAVDGYIQAGRGEIPAVNPYSADEDYLLEEK